MKVFVKTLKGTNFEIEVKPEDTVAHVKKTIETAQGSDVYPSAQQMLIYQDKVLKDNTTLEENKVAENSFIVILLSKTKPSTAGASTAAASSVGQSASSTINKAPETTAPQPPSAAEHGETDVYGQAASNLVVGTNVESTVQQILDMGGGSWDRDTVVRALCVAFNNPERAVEYLYSGIPEQADIPPVARPPTAGQAAIPPVQASQPVTPSAAGPNASPLDLFPQGLPNVSSNAAAGSLDFLRNSPQ